MIHRQWSRPVRLAIALLLVALPAHVLTSCGRAAARVRWPHRPNIVLLVVDDLDATFTPFWKAMPNTRKLIADRGLTFTNSFANNPLCCPARASILTGMYSHNNEVYDSVYGLDDFAARASHKTIGVRLGDAGYRTAFIGKYLNGYELDPSYVPAGWDEWFGLAGSSFLSGYRYQANHNGVMESYGRKPADYQTDVLSRVATKFVDSSERDDKQPFLLSLFPVAPHAFIPPAPRDVENPFVDASLPRRPNFDEANISDKPLWLRQGFVRLPADKKAQEIDEFRRRLGSLMAVDDMVGALEKRLRAKGEFDNTDFIFVSDNGFSLGSHRVEQKLVPYEESIRVPLAIAGPGVRHGTSDEMVGHIDLAPTIYELAGVPPPADVDGRSLGPILRGSPPKPSWRTNFMLEYNGTYSAYVQIHTKKDVEAYYKPDASQLQLAPDYRAVRTERWKYVRWYSGTDHEYELYDLKADPYELTNLVAHPAGAKRWAATVAPLRKRLDALVHCKGKACR